MNVYIQKYKRLVMLLLPQAVQINLKEPHLSSGRRAPGSLAVWPCQLLRMTKLIKAMSMQKQQGAQDKSRKMAYRMQQTLNHNRQRQAVRAEDAFKQPSRLFL